MNRTQEKQASNWQQCLKHTLVLNLAGVGSLVIALDVIPLTGSRQLDAVSVSERVAGLALGPVCSLPSLVSTAVHPAEATLVSEVIQT